MVQGNLLDLTIIEAAAQLEGRRLSPVELTEAMLQRIASVDKQIRAYITVCDAQAGEVARAACALGHASGVPAAGAAVRGRQWRRAPASARSGRIRAARSGCRRR